MLETTIYSIYAVLSTIFASLYDIIVFLLLLLTLEKNIEISEEIKSIKKLQTKEERK